MIFEIFIIPIGTIIKSETELIMESVSAPYLSGNFIDEIKVKRELKNIRDVINATFAAEWME